MTQDVDVAIIVEVSDILGIAALPTYWQLFVMSEKQLSDSFPQWPRTYEWAKCQ